MLLVTFQELTESGKPDFVVMDVFTFLQRPVERIQTYQALLKVSMQFDLYLHVDMIVAASEIYYS